jgi:HSP20 family protein
MAITRYQYRPTTYSPWRDLEEVSNRLSRLFSDSPFAGPADGGIWTPPMSVSETSDELILSAELPGMDESNVTVELENNVLTVSGEKTEERTEGEEERRYHLWERSYGAFKRSFTLPRTVSSDEAKATFENGVLTVRLPKVEEAKGRRIQIGKAG